jgi:aryl-alcohol dehydrogenase-like predicted oxidoreductase
MGLIPWSPLASGALGGGGRKGGGTGRREGDWGREQIERHGAKIAAFTELCARIGHEPADVAVAWLLHNPVVTAPIIGPRTMDQLEGALRAPEIKLEASTLAELDRIFPGPGRDPTGQGKPAPEAYAW